MRGSTDHSLDVDIVDAQYTISPDMHTFLLLRLSLVTYKRLYNVFVIVILCIIILQHCSTRVSIDHLFDVDIIDDQYTIS